MNFGINAVTINNIRVIPLLIGGLLFLNVVPIPVLSPIILVLLGIMLGLLIIVILAPDDFMFLLNIYLVGFILRIFLSFFFYILSFVFKADYSPGFLFSNDGWSYSLQGWQIYKFAERGIAITAENFMNNPNIKMLSGNIAIYDFFASHVYSVTGYSPLTLFFISSVAGAMTALFIYLIAKELFTKNIARIASILTFFWPSFIIWSTQNLKESMMGMLACISIWAVIYAYRHPPPVFLLLSIVSTWILSKLNFAYALIIVVIVLVATIVLFTDFLFKNRFIVILTLGLLFLASAPFIKDRIIDFISEKSLYDIRNYGSIFEFLDYQRTVRTIGRLQFFKNADITSFGAMVAFLPIGLLYAIFSPFPWQIGSLMQIMAVPETILFYILFPFTIKGMVFAYKRRFNQSALPLFIMAGILIFLGLVEGNSGTLFRHRFIAFNLLFIFTAVGLSLTKNSFRFKV